MQGPSNLKARDSLANAVFCRVNGSLTIVRKLCLGLERGFQIGIYWIEDERQEIDILTVPFPSIYVLSYDLFPKSHASVDYF